MKKAFKYLILLTSSSLLLTSCDQIGGIEESLGGIKDKIFPNIWVTLAQLIAFVLLCVIVYFIAYKPVKKFLKTRKDHVTNTLKEADEKLEEANIAKEKADDALLEANQTSVKIISDARDKAIKKQDEIVAEAEQIIKTKKERALKEIEDTRLNMEQDVHNTIVSTALDASKEILQREINEKDNEKIINDFIDEMNKKDD